MAMASHSIAIGKASLSVALMRADPNAVPKTEVTKLHALLDDLLDRCSTSNIQRCKEWLLEHIGSSDTRIGALGKYLLALSASSVRQSDVDANGPSARPRQLHFLYLVNDWLHHVKYHVQHEATFSTVASSVQPFLSSLFAHAAAFDATTFARHHARMEELLNLWSAKAFFPTQFLSNLQRQAADKVSREISDRPVSPLVKNPVDVNRAKQTQTPFQLPAVHGDPSVPYYDLPASTLMPHIIPNVVMPLNPHHIKPLECVPGPPDDKLVKALKEFMNDVDTLYDTYREENQMEFDIDEFGQRVQHSKDVATRKREGYYGWSRAFCEKMMRRQNYPNHDRDQRGSVSPRRQTVGSYSSGRSRSPSFTPPSDYNPSTRRFRGEEFQRRYRSLSPSGSPHSRSISNGRGRPSSPTQGPPYNSRQDRSRSRSYSPPAASQTSHPEAFLSPSLLNRPLPPPPVPLSFLSSNLPIPPRPPNYTGPWPPPPPPPPPLNGQASLPFPPPAGFPTLAGAHPPPSVGGPTFNDLAHFPKPQPPPPHGYGNPGSNGQGMRR